MTTDKKLQAAIKTLRTYAEEMRDITPLHATRLQSTCNVAEAGIARIKKTMKHQAYRTALASEPDRMKRDLLRAEERHSGVDGKPTMRAQVLKRIVEEGTGYQPKVKRDTRRGGKV